MSLLKDRKCKVCKVVIKNIYKSGTKQHANSMRRKFCSLRCKNKFGRDKIENKILSYCNVCNGEIWSYKSKIKKFCSLECKSKSQVKNDTLDKRICKNCGVSYYKKRYCKSNLYFCSRECHHESKRFENVCKICKNKFITKLSHKRKYCSRNCQFIAQSNGMIKVFSNGRSGYRTDLGRKYYFKSSFEADYARYLLYKNIVFEYEKTTFKFSAGRYTPDFYLPKENKFIELKGVKRNGKKFNNLMTKNILSHGEIMEKYNVVIEIIYMCEFVIFLKENNLWNKIENLEIKNYRKTKHLIEKLK